ncbi:MAG: flagellar motor protein MotA [Rhodospirillales bacterium]
MTRPRRYVVRMVVFLAAVAAVVALLFPGLQRAFWTNAPLNSLILAVFVAGILYSFRQVLRLGREVAWIRDFRDESGKEPTPPHLLAPLAAVLGDRRKRLSLSPAALRSLLDGIAARLDESRDLSRYTIGLLVFLGLLGTFWGLSQTIASIGQVIGGLQIGGGDVARMFDTLKTGLAAPLSGMGTAFSTSLFGLAGSLVLGFLDLQTGQAQNRFFNETEDWLASATRLPSGGILGDGGDASVPAYVQALLEQTAESLEGLQRTLQRGEESRIAGNTHLLSLTEKIGLLTDQMRNEQALMARLTETHSDLRPLLGRLGDGISQMGTGLDESTRTHIRNIDVYMARLIEEMIAGREETVRQIRSDIKLLARTIAAAAEEPDRT